MGARKVRTDSEFDSRASAAVNAMVEPVILGGGDFDSEMLVSTPRSRLGLGVILVDWQARHTVRRVPRRRCLEPPSQANYHKYVLVR